VLFVDAVQRMLRISAEAQAAKGTDRAGMHSLQTETNLAARKFYAQRNTYLTGFTLFLSLVLTRTFYIVLDLIHAQEEYAKLKGAQAGAVAAPGTAAPADAQKRIADLQAQVKALEVKERDFGEPPPCPLVDRGADVTPAENLKKQASQQATEYDRLATQYNNATGQKTDKRRN
jgi:B-cell receptor-associated protein 31